MLRSGLGLRRLLERDREASGLFGRTRKGVGLARAEVRGRLALPSTAFRHALNSAEFCRISQDVRACCLAGTCLVPGTTGTTARASGTVPTVGTRPAPGRTVHTTHGHH